MSIVVIAKHTIIHAQSALYFVSFSYKRSHEMHATQGRFAQCSIVTIIASPIIIDEMHRINRSANVERDWNSMLWNGSKLGRSNGKGWETDESELKRDIECFSGRMR